MNPRSLLALLILTLALAACSTMPVSSFGNGTPTFAPDRYFEGPTRSWGVLESRRDQPKSRFRTDCEGRRDGNVLVITQSFHFEDGHTQQRVWRLRRIDEHHFTATANDVVGEAPGEAYGNAFHWRYTLAAGGGNPFAHVQMEHWMYLHDDGETMTNRVTIRKFGVVLAHTIEYFKRGAGAVPPIAN